MCSHTDSQVLSCVPDILVSLTLSNMSNTIFLVEHLVRRENGKRQSLSMFQKVTLLGVKDVKPLNICSMLHSSRVFLLLLLYSVFMALSVRLRSEFSTRTFNV